MVHRSLSLRLALALTFALPMPGAAQPQRGQAGPPGLPPARQVPGITAADTFPGACVDCHLNYTEMNLDTRFSTLMKRWNKGVEPALLARAQASAANGVTLEGRHPAVDDVARDIPRACLACHANDATNPGKAPPFGRLMHSVHLSGGEKSPFMTIFQGECTHCHKLNPATGEWSLPSGAEK